MGEVLQALKGDLEAMCSAIDTGLLHQVCQTVLQQASALAERLDIASS